VHQNKPTAPITYLSHKGDTVLVDQDESLLKPLSLTLKEHAILQTCLNRSYFNCNCNLDKDVLASILAKTKVNLKEYQK
jgi:hypothetical protein